jgi:hypothetical protein
MEGRLLYISSTHINFVLSRSFHISINMLLIKTVIKRIVVITSSLVSISTCSTITNKVNTYY